MGTSQLTQARFGQDWGGAPNGGGVPINSAAEYARVYSAAQPMLVRTYAGTQRIAELAAMHEETLNIAWHALVLVVQQPRWPGTNPVERNLAEHLQTLDVIAATGKPFEPNIAHHFSFRGADDATGILATVLAVKAARLRGVRHVVLQVMLNTPRHTSGVADLAKARALLHGAAAGGSRRARDASATSRPGLLLGRPGTRPVPTGRRNGADGRHRAR